jgi:RNA polymerase sigma-70 factor (ECF subfamily)
VDRAIVERAQRGDRDAFSTLAIELSDRLFGVAHRILRDFDSASDALQVALVRIWRDLPGLRDADLLETWSYRVLVNACNDELRRAQRFKPEVRSVGLEHLPVADAYTSVADREALERAFRKLPVDQRAAIVLQHYRQLTMPEIALALGVPIGTVRSRLHYARQSLRAAMEADDRTPSTKEKSA